MERLFSNGGGLTKPEKKSTAYYWQDRCLAAMEKLKIPKHQTARIMKCFRLNLQKAEAVTSYMAKSPMAFRKPGFYFLKLWNKK